MTAADTATEDAIREIIESGEDVQRGWSDQRIVGEATGRIAEQQGAIRVLPDPTAMARWLTVIEEIRSESDNDGQERVPRRHDAPTTS